MGKNSFIPPSTIPVTHPPSYDDRPHHHPNLSLRYFFFPYWHSPAQFYLLTYVPAAPARLYLTTPTTSTWILHLTQVAVACLQRSLSNFSSTQSGIWGRVRVSASDCRVWPGWGLRVMMMRRRIRWLGVTGWRCEDVDGDGQCLAGGWGR